MGENHVSGLNQNIHTSADDMIVDGTTIEVDMTNNMVSLVQEGMGFPLSNDQASNNTQRKW